MLTIKVEEGVPACPAEEVSPLSFYMHIWEPNWTDIHSIGLNDPVSHVAACLSG